MQASAKARIVTVRFIVRAVYLRGVVERNASHVPPLSRPVKLFTQACAGISISSHCVHEQAAAQSHLHLFNSGQTLSSVPNFAPLQMKTGILCSNAYGLSAEIPTNSTLSNSSSSFSRVSSSTIKQFPEYPRGPQSQYVWCPLSAGGNPYRGPKKSIAPACP